MLDVYDAKISNSLEYLGCMSLGNKCKCDEVTEKAEMTGRKTILAFGLDLDDADNTDVA